MESALDHRLRRWSNIEPASCELLVFAECLSLHCFFSVSQAQPGIPRNIYTGECMYDTGPLLGIYRKNCEYLPNDNVQLSFYTDGMVKTTAGSCMGIYMLFYPAIVDIYPCLFTPDEYWFVETHQCGFYLDIRIRSYNTPAWCAGIDAQSLGTWSVPCANYTVDPSQWWSFNPVCSTSDGSIGKPANTRHPHNVGPMLGQRRRRWTNIGPTLGRCLVFAGKQ